MELKKKTIILGSTGFVGQAITEYLKAKKESLLTINSSNINLTDDEAHLKLSKIINDGDKIIMLSCITPDKRSDQNAFIENIKMSFSIIRALKNKKISHFIYFSSDAVYKDTDEIIDENSETSPSSIYGRMHLMREQIFSIFLNCPIAIIRPSLIFGENDTHNAYGPSKFINSALTEKKIILFGDGSDMRDHVDIHDVVRIITKILKIKYNGILNIVTGKSISYIDLSKLIRKNIKFSINFHSLPRKIPLYKKKYNNNLLFEILSDFNFNSISASIKRVIKFKVSQ